MAPSANALFQAAMDLPPEERASLAVKLLGTVDEPAPDDSAEGYEAWCRAVEGRLDALLSGKDRGEAWNVAHEQLAAELGQR